MKKIQDVLYKVSNIFPDRDAVVGGGAVRDFLMGLEPKDYDVFLLGSAGAPLAEIQDHLGQAVAKDPELEPVERQHEYEPFLIDAFRYRGSDVQVMTHPAETPWDLVETFDWACCRFAADIDGVLYTEEDASTFTPGRELELRACFYPLSSIRRGFRFASRFGMHITNETIRVLCRKVVVDEINKAKEEADEVGTAGVDGSDQKAA